MSLSATGASTSSGGADLTALIPGILLATGGSQSSGSASVTTTLPVGGVFDLGVWGLNWPDPAMCAVETWGVVFGRSSFTATAPTAYTTALGTLWNAAASVAATATWQETSPANTNLKAITDVQLEHAPPTNLLPADASDYRSQMPYAQASTTTSGVTTWDALPTRVQGHALSGEWCGQLANTGGFTPYSMGALPAATAAVSPTGNYMGSVQLSIERANASWYAQIIWYDANYNIISITTGTVMTHPGGGAYQQGVVRGLAPSTTTGYSVNAAWAAVVPAVTPVAVGDGELAWVDCHRLWSISLNETNVFPQAFQLARQQNITMVANRINYATNPSFTNNISGWWGVGGTTGSPATWDDTVGRDAPGSLKMLVPYVPGNTVYPQCGTYTLGTGGGGNAPGIVNGSTGGTYTLSAYVLPLPGMPTIKMWCVLGGGEGGVYVQGTTTAEVAPDENGWYRLSVTVTVPQSTAGSLSVLFNISEADWASYATTIGWWIDDLLVEESPVVGDYFDATFASPDYIWEGTPFASRSHYYQDLRFLEYRLNELLADALPVGVPYQLLFAQPNT